jgi:hypothetical protein
MKYSNPGLKTFALKLSLLPIYAPEKIPNINEKIMKQK